jgi:hypothetical protein
MVFNYTYKLSYYIDEKCNELIIEVNLKEVEGKLNNYQNIHYGELKINDKINKDYDLSHCVNAQFGVEFIVKELINKLAQQATSENKTFKVINNEDKSIKKNRK